MFIFYKHFIGQIERKFDLGLITMVPGRKKKLKSKSDMGTAGHVRAWNCFESMSPKLNSSGMSSSSSLSTRSLQRAGAACITGCFGQP